MSKRKPCNPKHIKEVEALKSEYDVVLWATGTYLVEDWLFIYPRNGKWGDRYRRAWGFYDHGNLRQFVEQATENKLSGHYAGDKSVGRVQ